MEQTPTLPLDDWRNSRPINQPVLLVEDAHNQGRAAYMLGGINPYECADPRFVAWENGHAEMENEQDGTASR